MSDFERELGWEDEIQKDSEFEVLPKGDYDFEVIDFKRGRYDGGPNLPACNKAIISLKLTGKGGAATITQNLFLHSKTEGILCAFFEAIGQRKHGESLKMNWGNVVGSKGSLKLGINKWTNKDDEEMESNEVKKYYLPGNIAKSNNPVNSPVGEELF